MRTFFSDLVGFFYELANNVVRSSRKDQAQKKVCQNCCFDTPRSSLDTEAIGYISGGLAQEPKQDTGRYCGTYHAGHVWPHGVHE